MRKKKWSTDEMKCEGNEQAMLNQLYLCISLSVDLPQPSALVQRIQKKWHLPPSGFIKLNFDKPSKSNHDYVGFGVSFRDNQGFLCHILVEKNGHNSNNVVELWDLTMEIQTTIYLCFHQLIVEGDSQIIISMISKLKDGSEPTKSFPSWRLLGSLESLKNTISPHMVIIPSHVCKEANNIADKLVNAKIDKKNRGTCIVALINPQCTPFFKNVYP
jgi:ribonuclease HI